MGESSEDWVVGVSGSDIDGTGDLGNVRESVAVAEGVLTVLGKEEGIVLRGWVN